MSAVITGKASIYGSDGVRACTGYWTAEVFPVQSASLSDKMDKKELRDGNNELLGMRYSDHRRELSIKFKPTGANEQVAQNASALPAIPSKVTLSSFGDVALPVAVGANTPQAYGGPQLNGDWIYDGGGSIEFSQDNDAVMTLPLWQAMSSSLTATQLTTAATPS